MGRLITKNCRMTAEVAFADLLRELEQFSFPLRLSFGPKTQILSLGPSEGLQESHGASDAICRTVPGGIVFQVEHSVFIEFSKRFETQGKLRNLSQMLMKFFLSQFLQRVCVSKSFSPICARKRHRSIFRKTRKGLSQMRKQNPGRVRSGTRC